MAAALVIADTNAANGNQTTRNIDGSISTFTYDYGNRLTSVNGATSASFVYDGSLS